MGCCRPFLSLSFILDLALLHCSSDARMNLPNSPSWQVKEKPDTLVGLDGRLIRPDEEKKKPETQEERLKRNGWRKKRGEWLAPAGPTSATNQILRSALGIKTQGKGDYRNPLGPALPPSLEEQRREERRERKEKKRKKEEKRKKKKDEDDRRKELKRTIAIDTSDSDSEAEKRRERKRKKLEKIIRERKKLKKKLKEKE